MKVKIVLSVILALALISGIIGGTWAFRYYTAETRGKVGAEETIQSPGYRIAKYDHFFNLLAAIEGYSAQLQAQRDLLVVVSDAQKDRVLQNIAALTGHIHRCVAQYNQDAQKEYTAGQFRDSKLPYELDPNDYVKEK